MEHEHDHGHIHPDAPPPAAATNGVAGIPSTVDLAGLLSMAKSLAGSGVTLPDWVKWAAGAAVLGGAIGLIVSQPPVHVVAAAAPATPFVAAAGGGASGWMCP